MATDTAIRLIHPAAKHLRDDALAERRALTRALSIEADWRYHDGPEWALRYWSAFGDLQEGAVNPGDSTAAVAVREAVSPAIADRAEWPALPDDHARQIREIFRALLSALHPEVQPQAAADARAAHWPLVKRAYRGGDLNALREQLGAVRSLRYSAALPKRVVALRAECARLEQAREKTDRRLAELSQTFPFCMRDKLADADWIRRQRLALRQIRVLTAPPVHSRDSNPVDRREQVS